MVDDRAGSDQVPHFLRSVVRERQGSLADNQVDIRRGGGGILT